MPRHDSSGSRRGALPRGTIRPHPGFDEEAALAQVRTLRRALQRPVDAGAVIEVLTKILQQGTEFNMLAETVLADRCGDTLGY